MFNKMPLRAWFIPGVLFVLLILVFNILTDGTRDASVIKFSEFRTAVEAGQVETVEIKDLEVSGEFS